MLLNDFVKKQVPASHPQGFATWKYAVIVGVMLISMLYLLPNFYPEYPALQISGKNARIAVTTDLLHRVERLLTIQNIAYRDHQLDTAENRGQILIRFDGEQQQQLARNVIVEELGEDYIVALNFIAEIPQWLNSLGGKRLDLGLDLRGGVHFLLEVDLPTALTQRMESFAVQMRRILRAQKLPYRSFQEQMITETVGDTPIPGIIISFDSATDAKRASTELSASLPQLNIVNSAEILRIYPAADYVREIEDFAISQNLTALRNRVNELGVAEPVVQRQGRHRIVLQLPGVQDIATAKRVIGATANLEFRLEARDNAGISNSERFAFRDAQLPDARLERDIIITGSSVINAQTGFDESGLPQVSVGLDAAGGRSMNRATRNEVGRRMGVLFIESNRERVGEQYRTITEKQIISLATIRSPLGNQFRITGLYNQQEASELALLLRAGALAAPVYFVEERTVGPSLGEENIARGLWSLIAGFILVFLFMLGYYKAFGLIANLALLVNLSILIAVLSAISATLTLPGIAGIVLMIGMAVDANVLIFERVKEELRAGLRPLAAIEGGFNRAYITILDANITTLIVAIILFVVGSGPVRGFAVTLSLGIMVSLFTVIMFSRGMIHLYYAGTKKLWL